MDEGPDRDKLTEALAKEKYVPVYLDQRTVDLHYNGFCNSVLWQLFHYVPLNMDSKLSETRHAPFPILISHPLLITAILHPRNPWLFGSLYHASITIH